MAENKKSFLFYCDWIDTFKNLNKEKGYDLLIHLLKFVNDENPTTDDPLIKALFPIFKNQLKRDLNKWEEKTNKKSNSGQLGNIKRWHPEIYKKVINKELTINEALENIALNRTAIAKVAKIAVIDNVIDNDNVIVKDKVIVTKKEYNTPVKNTLEKCLEHFPEQLKPSTEKEKENWLEVIEKLNRIDKIPFEWIEKITARARSDDFWSKNFLSLTKLRKKNPDGIKYIQVFYENFKRNDKKNSDNQPNYDDYKKGIANVLTGTQPE